MDFSTKIKMILESFLILHPEEPPVDYHRFRFYMHKKIPRLLLGFTLGFYFLKLKTCCAVVVPRAYLINCET